MAKKTNARTTVEQQAAEVLASRTTPTAAELASLVREVNPTDRALDRKQREARYALKAQLQSLLLCRFAGSVLVELAPELGDGMILLRLANGGTSAGHVPLLELDEEARSVARLKLDAHPEVHPSGAPIQSQGPRRPASIEARKTWRQEAQAALDNYDYEEARLGLEAALKAGEMEAAELLLLLLVDTLGLDQEAWDVTARIDGKTRQSPGLRRLIGTAAVRLERLEEAERELGGLRERDSAPALALLARAWLARGREDRAASWLEATRQADPTEPSIASLEKEMGNLRAGAREREELAVQRLLDEGRGAEAVEAAQALLARFQDSPLARRILREEEQRQRREKLAVLASEIDLLEQQGALQSALELARKASSMADPAEQPRWLERAQKLQTSVREKATQEEVGQVLALSSGDPRPLIQAFVASSSEVRARVRDVLAQDLLLDWAQQALASPTTRREQVVDAVLALHQARDLRDADPEACLSLLARHASALEGIREAMALRQAAQEGLELRRRHKAEALLRQAEGALAEGKYEETMALLPGSAVERWPASEATRARALVARAGELQQLESLQSALGEATERADFFEALRILSRLEEMTAEKTRWSQERIRLEARLRSSLCWRSVEHEGPPDEQVAPFGSTSSQPEPCLTDDGQHLVHVSCHERWIFIRVFSVRTARIVRRIQLRAPVSFGISSAIPVGDSVLLESDSGHVMRLSLPGWEPVDFWESTPVLRNNERVYSSCCAMDGRYLWLTIDQRGSHKERGVVVDLQRRIVVRDFKKGRGVEPFLGETPRMVQLSSGRQISLLEPNGNQTAMISMSADGRPMALVSTPDGSHAVLLHIDLEEGGGVFQLRLLAPDGTVRATSRVRGLDSERISQFHLADGRLWLWALDDSDWRYWLVEIDATNLHEISRKEAPEALAMVASITGEHLCLAYGAGEGCRIEPVRAGMTLAALRRGLQSRGLLPFVVLPSAGREEAMRLEREVRELAPSGLEAWVAASCRREDSTATSLACLAEALESTDRRELASRVLRLACERYPGDPILETRHAFSLLREHRFQEALEHARKADCTREQGRSQCSEPRAQFEAMAAIYLGDFTAAHRAIQSQEPTWSGYHRTLPGWLRATAGPEVPPLPESPEEDDWLLLLLDAIRQADEALEAKDPRAARRALSSVRTFLPSEAQLLARHWAMWLQSGPTEPEELLLATEAAAALVSAMSARHILPGAPLPGRSWPLEKLVALLEQARAWLQSVA